MFILKIVILSSLCLSDRLNWWHHLDFYVCTVDWGKLRGIHVRSPKGAAWWWGARKQPCHAKGQDTSILGHMLLSFSEPAVVLAVVLSALSLSNGRDNQQLPLWADSKQVVGCLAFPSPFRCTSNSKIFLQDSRFK